ncbi:MAG: flagellar hook-basal body complex protein [Planctomycetes bacterium]|nr:flagellar hook-basal body complex protein [Planctomycetota bacterium]
MSLSAAMLTGFTGIKSNSVGVDTVGDNLANVNTTAFKNQRTLFETLLYRTISEGEGPSATSGGTLPRQIGSGSGVASIQRNFEPGGIDSTGFPSDLAIDGDGFFIVNSPAGDQLYTRDGSFRLDATQTLVAANGNPVQVFAADAAGQITPGTLSNLVIPLGTATEAVATSQAVMNGQLDAAAGVASQGAVVATQPLATASGAAAGATTDLTDLVDDNGVPLFATGDELAINGTKGGIATPESIFVVGTTGSTLGELARHLEAAFGINTDPAAGGAPGVTVAAGPTPAAGSLVIASNVGEINAVGLDAGSITNRTGAVASPFAFSTVTPALGDGVTTSFGVFDSLGNLVDVRLRAVLESKSDAGTTWRFFAESEGDSDASSVLGTGTISFDANGQFVAATGTDLTLDRANSGAATPLAVTLDFSSLTGLASPDGESQLIMASQDGAPAGIMTGFGIDDEGVVTGAFSNQQTRVLGQVALATFRNNEGLVALSDNTYAVGPNSGDATIVAPRTGVAGAIVSGGLEQSNVEIAREFINLIQNSTGIAAASRVVRVSDELLQELLLLAR